MTNIENLEISIIVPAYNAEKFIYQNLIDIYKLLNELGKRLEIICIVDGATDKTKENARKAAKGRKEIMVFSYEKNHGKGYAVRYGMKKARGEIIGFVDAGGDLLYEDLLKLLELVDNGNEDIVIGSKRHLESKVNYSNFRKYFSFGYQFYVKNLFGLSVDDTQVGMKIFKGKIVKKILSALTIDGFAFDIEILSVASKLLGVNIIEAPIHVNLDENDSTIKIKGGFLINSLKVFWDTLKIFYRLNISGYYRKVIQKNENIGCR